MSLLEPFLAVGQCGSYRWLEVSPSRFLADIVEACPAVACGQYLAVTSYDFTAFKPTDEGFKLGWTFVDDVAYSPKVDASLSLWSEGGDEWYIHEVPELIGSPEVFATFVGFSLRPPGPHSFADLGVLQQRFWQQLEQLGPSSYMADNDARTMVVTRDQNLFDTLVQHFRQGE